tara:strand:- start:491 stop:1480 length:990 start_codon:yes stop_codon:yes gene_type:complete
VVLFITQKKLYMSNSTNYVTYFDKNYLVQGLTLINNIQEKSNYNKIIVVTLDNYTEEALIKLNLEDVFIVNICKIIENQKVDFKNKRTRREYIWTLTPMIIKYTSIAFNSDYLIYLDADMFMLKSDINILEKFIQSNKSTFITPHFYAPNLDQTESSGRFCVQYLIFNLKNSRDIIDDWVDDCLDDCSEDHSIHGMGDQKYLTFWEKKYKNRIYVATDNGFFLAPWNLNYYRYSDAIFFHFQGFKVYKNKYCILLNSFEINKYVKKFIYHKYIIQIKKSIELLHDKNILINRTFHLIDYCYIAKLQIVFTTKYFLKKIISYFPLIIKKI